MNAAARSLLIVNLALANLVAEAQLDSPSTSLLRPKTRATSPENLDMSKYKIRAPESRLDDYNLDETPGAVIPTPVPAAKKEPPTKPAEPVAPPVTPFSSPAPAAAATAVPVPGSALPPTPPPVTEQVRDLILGGSPIEIEEMKKQIHPEDPRANLMSISIAPGYYYNASASGYSFRRYHSQGPALGLGMNFWITPAFGIQSSFFNSVSASQRSGGVNFVPIDLQEFSAGFRFRKYFGYSRRAAHLEWGLDYQDSINKISKSSLTAVGRKSSGLSVAIEGVVPSTVSYATTFGLQIRPRMKHSELETGVEVVSGAKSETNALGVSFGGQWTLDRRNQVFWRGQYSVERNLFSGEASTMDPHSGVKPDGVSVTNSLMIFYFGFKWGS